jgi:hypothetical protein
LLCWSLLLLFWDDMILLLDTSLGADELLHAIYLSECALLFDEWD